MKYSHPWILGFAVLLSFLSSCSRAQNSAHQNANARTSASNSAPVTTSPVASYQSGPARDANAQPVDRTSTNPAIATANPAITTANLTPATLPPRDANRFAANSNEKAESDADHLGGLNRGYGQSGTAADETTNENTEPVNDPGSTEEEIQPKGPTTSSLQQARLSPDLGAASSGMGI